MTDALERRYARLLRAYPSAYRKERGSELLDTLIEGAAPGQTRPSRRESIALVVAGVRARIDANRRRGVAASMRSGAVLGALVYLSQRPGFEAADLAAAGRWQFTTSVFVAFAAFAAVRFRRPLWVLAVPAVAGLAAIPMHMGAFASMDGNVMVRPTILDLLAVAVIAVAGRRGDPRPPLSWPMFMLAMAAQWFAIAVTHHELSTTARLVVPAAMVLYGLLDARAALGAIWFELIAFAAACFDQMTTPQRFALPPLLALPTAVAVAGFLLGIWRAHREAAL